MALAERVEKLSRVRVLDGIRKKLPDVLSRPDLEMVALDYFRRLGHDNHRRLSKLYAWEEKKSKTSWGAETVDYEKIAAAAVQVMTAADQGAPHREASTSAAQTLPQWSGQKRPTVVGSKPAMDVARD